jgi:hypothetical protein
MPKDNALVLAFSFGFEIDCEIITKKANLTKKKGDM